MKLMLPIRGYERKYKEKKSETIKRFTYKNGTTRKLGSLFSLSLECYIDIMNSDCHYCGAEPKEKKYISPDKQRYTWVNSQTIDRVDCNNGYTFYNVVPCCMKCNILKSYMDYDEFQKRKQEIYYYAENKTYAECYGLGLKFSHQLYTNVKNNRKNG